MSFRSKLRVVIVCLILQAGAMMNCPMRPGEIEELMHQMNEPKLAYVLPSEDDDSGDPPDVDGPVSPDDDV